MTDPLKRITPKTIKLVELVQNGTPIREAYKEIYQSGTPAQVHERCTALLKSPKFIELVGNMEETPEEQDDFVLSESFNIAKTSKDAKVQLSAMKTYAEIKRRRDKPENKGDVTAELDGFIGELERTRL